MSRLFSTGCLAVTPGICSLIQAGVDITPLLLRHQYGDWGDLDNADKAANDRAVRDGDRILSVYQVSPAIRIWILTQEGTTTVMLPEEY